MWAIKGRIVYSRLNYYKVKITENSGAEWNEIVRETVWKIDKKALIKQILSFYYFFLIIAYTNFYPGYPDIFSRKFYLKNSKNIYGMNEWRAIILCQYGYRLLHHFQLNSMLFPQRKCLFLSSPLMTKINQCFRLHTQS